MKNEFQTFIVRPSTGLRVKVLCGDLISSPMLLVKAMDEYSSIVVMTDVIFFYLTGDFPIFPGEAHLKAITSSHVLP